MPKNKEFHFRSWLIGALRRASRRFPPHYKVENAAKEEYFVDSKHGKAMRRVQFVCAECGDKVPSKNKVRDHIDPIIPPATGFPVNADGSDNWNEYIKRMYCDSNNMQILCKPCHKLKCNSENKERVVTRRKKKIAKEQ